MVSFNVMVLKGFGKRTIRERPFQMYGVVSTKHSRETWLRCGFVRGRRKRFSIYEDGWIRRLSFVIAVRADLSHADDGREYLTF